MFRLHNMLSSWSKRNSRRDKRQKETSSASDLKIKRLEKLVDGISQNETKNGTEIEINRKEINAFPINNEKTNRPNLRSLKNPQKKDVNNSMKPTIKREIQSSVEITQEEVAAFFGLLDTSRIRNFLQRDSCYKISDKYLLAMVFVYFKRARLRLNEYTTKNFFVALFLANDMEEDDEEEKHEILIWTYYDEWRLRYREFMKRRDKLWMRMDHRAVVSTKTCRAYFEIMPNHPVWKRNRQIHHAGSKRYYGWNCAQRPLLLFGPLVSPPKCRLCDPPSDGSSTSSIMMMLPCDTHNFTPFLPCVDKLFETVDKAGDSIFEDYYYRGEE